MTQRHTIETAIAEGHLALVQTFLEQQPQLLERPFADNAGLTPLMWACRRRQHAIAQDLLQRGANVLARNILEPRGEGGNFALWFTANGNSPGGAAIARLLLTHGAEVDMVGEYGETALHQAAAWNNVEVAGVLIEWGADIHAEPQPETTSLSIALRHQHSSVTNLLRQAGATH